MGEEKVFNFVGVSTLVGKYRNKVVTPVDVIAELLHFSLFCSKTIRLYPQKMNNLDSETFELKILLAFS